MGMTKSMRVRMALVSILLALSSCFSAELPALPAPSGLTKLRQLSDQTLSLIVTTEGTETSRRGFQYLFLALPFSRVYTPHIESDVTLQLSVAAALRGYNLITASSEQAHLPELKVSVTSLGVDGYDLVVVRKPTASVTLKGSLSRRGEIERACEASAVASDTAAYAFAGELQSAESEALLSASNKLLDCLGLTK